MWYLLKKIGYAISTLFGVVSLVFFLFYLMPGDPADLMLGQNQTQDQVRAVQQKYGLDLPVSRQYLYYLNDLSPLSLHRQNPRHFTHDKGQYTGVDLFTIGETQAMLKWPYLRESYQKTGLAVSTIIADRLPNTAVLAIAAISFALVIGLLLGVLSALYRDTYIDKGIQLVSTLGMSVPSFFSAIIIAYLFGFLWHSWTGLPMSGSLYALDDAGTGVYIQWHHLVLPAFVLGVRPLSVISQLMRNSLLEVLSEEYILTARAKGLSPYQVIARHAFKNALNPVITAVSGWFASMLAGAVFVEYIFGWNGLGKEIVDALNTQDFPVIVGAVLVIATLFILINMLVDVLYGFLDPRVRV